MNRLSSTLRLKVIGRCNRKCCFCHEEGGLSGVESMAITSNLVRTVDSLCKALKINVISLTGGEPLLYEEIVKLVDALAASDIERRFSMTTNGTVEKDRAFWQELTRNGLSKVNVSVPDWLDGITQADSAHYSLGGGTSRGATLLDTQVATIGLLNEIGVNVDVNSVVFNDYAFTFSVLRMLLDLQSQGLRFRIMLLPDLTSSETIRNSFEVLERLRTAGGLQLVERVGLPASSNSVTEYSADGRSIYFKSTMMEAIGAPLTTEPYYAAGICDGCPVRERGECQEGFYGPRLEQREGTLWVRLCLHRRTDKSHHVLQPAVGFMESSEFRALSKLWNT